MYRLVIAPPIWLFRSWKKFCKVSILSLIFKPNLRYDWIFTDYLLVIYLGELLGAYLEDFIWNLLNLVSVKLNIIIMISLVAV